jgi:S-adenosyl methyltransferase
VAIHATSLLPVTSEGATSFIAADVRDPDTILIQAQRTLDFSQPVAIMLLGILQLIPDADDPWAIVARLGQPAVPGSYLVISHPARDIPGAEQGGLAERLSAPMPSGLMLRSGAEVQRMFSGFTLVPPGLVPLDRWHPELGDTGTGLRSTAHGGVGRKYVAAPAG